MPVIALFDSADGFDQVVDIKFARLGAQAANLDRPRLSLPTAVCIGLRIPFFQSPFVKIVVAGDIIVRRDFSSGQSVARIERIRKARGRGANYGR